MSAHRKPLRVGRLGAWHRRLSYAVFGACALTGLAWFLLRDVGGWEPPRLVFWWIAHALSGLLALLVLGAALPHHVPTAWRHFRNRLLGGLTLGMLAFAVVAMALLLYGKDTWHPAAHWAHVVAGLAGGVVVGLHAWRGRGMPARLAPPGASRH
jgi:hypothetical protein